MVNCDQNGKPPNNTEVEMDYYQIKSDFDDPAKKMKRKYFYYRIIEVLRPKNNLGLCVFSDTIRGIFPV